MISANRTRLVRKLNVPLPVISPSAVLADVTQSRRSNIPFDDQEPLANHAEIGFNHCWQPSQIIPHSQMKAPRRLGAIVFFSGSTATLYALGCLMWWFGGLIRLNLFMVCIVALRLVLRLAQQNNIPRMCWIANSDFASADLASMRTWNTLFTWWGSFISMEIR